MMSFLDASTLAVVVGGVAVLVGGIIIWGHWMEDRKTKGIDMGRLQGFLPAIVAYGYMFASCLNALLVVTGQQGWESGPLALGLMFGLIPVGLTCMWADTKWNG